MLSLAGKKESLAYTGSNLWEVEVRQMQGAASAKLCARLAKRYKRFIGGASFVADFARLPDVLERMMALPLVQSDLGAALHVGVQ